jgi:hypothetical protein
MQEATVKELTREEHEALFAKPNRAARRAAARKPDPERPAKPKQVMPLPSVRDLFAMRHVALGEAGEARMCACRQMSNHWESETIYA